MISIEEGGTSAHLAHLTVSRTVSCSFSPISVSFPFFTTLRRNMYQPIDVPNVRFLMIVIEILLLLN